MVLVTVVGLWFTPFLLHRIGERDFGLWSVATPILAYVAFVEFGVMTIFQRDVSFAVGAAGGERRGLRVVERGLRTTLRLVLFQWPVLALASCLVLWRLPAEWSTLRGPLAVTLGAFTLTFPLRTYHALLMGLQDLKFIGVLNITLWGVGIVVSVGLVLLGRGLYAVAISWGAVQVGTYAIAALRAHLVFGYGLVVPWRGANESDALSRLKKGFWVIMSQVAVMLASGTDVVVVASILGPSAVTPYTITDKLITMFNSIPLQIMAMAQPGLGELSQSSSRGRLADVCTALTRVVLLVSGLVAVLVFALNRAFVGWWVGAGHFAGGGVSALLAVGMILGHWAAAIGYALFCFGYERLVSITGIIHGAVTVILTVLATRYLGLGGAPLGAIGAYAVVIPILLVALAREIGTTVQSQLAAVFAWCWRLALLSGAAAATARFYVPTTLVGLSAVGTGVVATYGALMYPLALDEPLGSYVRPRAAAIAHRFRAATP